MFIEIAVKYYVIFLKYCFNEMLVTIKLHKSIFK